MISLTVRRAMHNAERRITLTAEFRVVTLMCEIQLIWDISLTDQLLVFDDKLMNKKHADLSDYGVKDSDLIVLHRKFFGERPLKVTVMHHDGLNLVVDAETQWSIIQFKGLIDMRIGIPPHRQRLEYKGALMDDNNMMLDYVIDHIPMVYLTELPWGTTFEIGIYNKENGGFEIMTVDGMDTLYTVGAEMQRRGLNQGRYFYFNQRPSMGAALWSCGIVEGTNIELCCFPQHRL